MASVYRAKYKRPIPEGAEIITRQGVKYARWEDNRGRKYKAPLDDSDPTKVVHEYKHYTIEFQDENGVRQKVKGFRDKSASETRARELEKNAEKRAAGELTYDIENAAKPLAEAVASWVADLTRCGRSAAYVYNMKLLMEQMATGCGWYTLGSIRSDSLIRWLAAKRTRPTKNCPQGEPLSGRSQNQYLETAIAFINWCRGLKPPWLSGNPLENVNKVDESDPRREKRAYTLDELERLRQVAEPRGRWVVYITAALTGLRLSELGKLQRGDIHLEAEFPYIKLRAKTTKAKRADTIPMNPELCEVLGKHLAGGGNPEDPVFKSVPKYETFRKDVETRAKIPWRDGRGRLASFHALRKTFGTYLALANVSIRESMLIMRVTAEKLLTEIYTDARLLNTSAAVGRLPRLVAQEEAEAEEANEEKLAG
jgi:integrase